MTKSLNISTVTFYSFVSFSVFTPAMAETSPSAVTYVEVEEEALEDLDSAALDNLTAQYSEVNSVELEPEWNWTDETRKEVKDKLDEWANEMNGWFGEPDPKKPATASLRLVLDTRWANDTIEGNEVTVEPRIRGRLRLPVLEERLSLIIGDGDLDEDTFLKSGATNEEDISEQDKFIDAKRARDENASIALRWSRFDDQIQDRLGVKTDVDFGVRSVDDLYVKVSLDKDWYESEKLTISNDNFYRYGLDSKHYVKGAINLKYGTNPNRFINNRTTIRYRNQDDEKSTDWINELRQVHYLGNEKQLAYGISTSGYFDHDKSTVNSYGPVIGYRQPIWREWFYVQAELNYLNDKTDDKDHYPSALLRMEALF